MATGTRLRLTLEDVVQPALGCRAVKNRLQISGGRHFLPIDHEQDIVALDAGPLSRAVPVDLHGDDVGADRSPPDAILVLTAPRFDERHVDDRQKHEDRGHHHGQHDVKHGSRAAKRCHVSQRQAYLIAKSLTVEEPRIRNRRFDDPNRSNTRVKA
jgi:hypothetical protein